MAERCPRCKERISSVDFVVECPNCKKLYHEWCWGIVDKCSSCGAPNDNNELNILEEIVNEININDLYEKDGDIYILKPNSFSVMIKK